MFGSISFSGSLEDVQNVKSYADNDERQVMRKAHLAL